MKETLTFNDVLIVPKFSTVESRKDVNLSFNGPGYPYMELPVISANMDSVTGPEMARAMLAYGAQACLHRFYSIDENVKAFIDSKVGGTGGYRVPMVSIGLGVTELDRAKALYDAGAQTFIIDVAHGAQMAVVNQLKALREIVLGNGGIVVGNFASRKSVRDFLVQFNGNLEGIKVGVGPGSACSTRVKTGIGYPQFSAVSEICEELVYSGITVIADGGLKTPGDCAKALGAGASLLMMGGMLAGTEESPGDKVWETNTGYHGKEIVYPKKRNDDGILVLDMNYEINLPCFKKYRGSASKESYDSQGKTGSHRTSEGESFYVPYKGSVKDVLQDIEGGLRSAFTYVGAYNLDEFHSNVEFIRITNAGYAEGLPHGKTNSS